MTGGIGIVNLPIALALQRPLRHLSRGGALAVLLVVLATLVWSVAALHLPASTDGSTPQAVEPGSGDFALYARIADRVAEGNSYYSAALDEQRAADFPTRPFITVRLPTLAWLNAALGREGTRVLAIALLFAAILAWQRALADRSIAVRIAATVLVFLGGLAAFEPRAGLSHELIAGLLLALALALWRTQHWTIALLPLAAALAVRELALPFALLWLGLAVLERRWREAAALARLLAIFAIGLGLHYLAVEAVRLPGDRASPGWAGLEGPGLVLVALVRFTPLIALPGWLAGPLAMAPLLGWAALGGRLGLLAFAWFAGFMAMMAVLARTDNFYWALLLLPAYAAGLAFVPQGVADLIAALRVDRRRG